MVVRSFKKCGISLSLDGSENGDFHIETIEEYQLPTADEITEFELDSESEIEDDEDNFEVTDSCGSSKNENYPPPPPVTRPPKSSFEII